MVTKILGETFCLIGSDYAMSAKSEIGKPNGYGCVNLPCQSVRRRGWIN